MYLSNIYGFYPVVENAKWIKKLLPIGVKTIQLRIKNSSHEKIKSEIKEAISYSKNFDCQLVINDYWELALKYDAKYIHLGQEDLAKADIQAIEKANIKYGISTHSIPELENAMKYNPSYIALGPIYPTKTKDMPWKPQGLKNIQIWKEKISCPLVAIGGISIEKAPSIIAAGASSIAVITDITQNITPIKHTKKWIEFFENYS